MTVTPRDDREGDVLAVVGQSGPSVSFFDAATDRHLGSVATLAEPHELAFDPVERLLWVTMTYYSGFYHANTGRRTELTVIDPDARRVVDVVDLAPEHAPHGIALDVARRRVYVSVEGSDERPGGVVVLDAGTRRPIGRIDSGAPGAHWIALDAAGRVGCVANKEAPFVSVLDLERGTLTGRAPVPSSEGVAVSADGARAYAASPFRGSFFDGDEPESAINVIDTVSATVIDALPTENSVLPVHLTSTGLLLVGEVRTRGRAMAPGRLTVFSADTHKEIGGLDIGTVPLTVHSSPDGRLGYVACFASATVEVVDLASLRRVSRLDLGAFGESGAHGLAYIPSEGAS
ncbi:PQQ-dependent catabolism-associated beta-propeller protein [Actinomadura rubteroloni]|uniref:PQQ-dependent catabolism-associated beta-propeller protein n=1 Tax=Actinomadura rubteroloni TaxID=1926885 RepID=A0A2P4UJG9_9ACTN|nr:YncE family protein [Actinomadura rubteroloni]POM25158.1 PQQ-dependent catabolism-associated beta-propeller protein [Actinomadura rubteroloni]